MRFVKPIALAALVALSSGLAHAGSAGLTYAEVIHISANEGASGPLAPVVRIVSPLNGGAIAGGTSRVGAGSSDGTNFVVNLEVVMRDKVRTAVREATIAPPVFGIRHVPELDAGANNPDFPGLYLFFDADLITPDGTVLPKFTNFASAFNVAGTDDTPGPGVTLWAGWHVLESLPADVDTVTMTAAVVDDKGRIGLDRIKLHVDHGKLSGQALTPPAESFPGGIGIEDASGPEITMIAPRVPSAIAVGPTDNSLTPNNGSLFFIQVSALDRHRAGIAVNETGERAGNTLPVGLIFDPTQIPNTALHTPAGPNRNYPGLTLTFDVPLRQPSGNVVPAGVNLAPLFDVAGSEIDAASGAVRTTADWVVGGSLQLPTGQKTVTITASVTDNQGHKNTTKNVVAVSDVVSGQDLTTTPATAPAAR